MGTQLHSEKRFVCFDVSNIEQTAAQVNPLMPVC
jgi:hypothetical protein